MILILLLIFSPPFTTTKHKKIRLRSFKHLIVLLIICLTSSCGDPYQKLYGQWEVYKYLLYELGKVYAFSDTELQDFVGKSIVLDKRYASTDIPKAHWVLGAGNLGLKNPQYILKQERTNDYLYYLSVPEKGYLKSSGIGGDTLEILSIVNPQTQKAVNKFIVQKDNLVINIDGAFFFLRKKPITK